MNLDFIIFWQSTPNQTLMIAKRWRLFFAIFVTHILVVGLIFFADKENKLFGAVMIFFNLIRLPGLYIVHKFVQELQRVGDGPPAANTNSQPQQHPSQYQQHP